MYQPYPGSETQLPESPRGPAPASVLTAVKAMYAGAAVSFVGLVIDIVTIDATKAAIEKHSPNLTASQVHSNQLAVISGGVAGAIIAAVAWILLARACQRGRNWARITGTVLFAIATLDNVVSLTLPIATLARIWSVVIWLAGLTAVVFLWRRDSRAYFKQPPA